MGFRSGSGGGYALRTAASKRFERVSPGQLRLSDSACDHRDRATEVRPERIKAMRVARFGCRSGHAPADSMKLNRSSARVVRGLADGPRVMEWILRGPSQLSVSTGELMNFNVSDFTFATGSLTSRHRFSDSASGGDFVTSELLGCCDDWLQRFHRAASGHCTAIGSPRGQPTRRGDFRPSSGCPS